MKIERLKEYIKGRSQSVEEALESYVRLDLMEILREIKGALVRLRFVDNFESFSTTIDIGTSSEVAIPNQLGTIPSHYIIIRKNAGGIYVCDGDTEWTSKWVYLKNTSATLAASITVVFFK